MTFVLFILCIVSDVQILTVPTKAQFYYYVFHSYLAATCFGLTVMIKELTLILLKVYSNKIVVQCLHISKVKIIVKIYSI
jgi:hypothetical protein